MHKTSFFLGYDALERYKVHRKIQFADQCCACSSAPDTTIDCRRHDGILGLLFSEVAVCCVPHCTQHAKDGLCKLTAEVMEWTPAVIRLVLRGYDCNFLEETRILNRQVDVVPPWVAFGQTDAFVSNWRQGNNEYWWHNEWLPFWHALSLKQKESYLQRHSASDEWRRYLK